MHTRYSITAALSSAALAVSILASSAGVASAQTDLDSFTFQRIASPADPTFTQLLGINNQQLIAGYHTNTPGNKGLTLNLPSGTFTDENFPNSAQTQVVGINNNGDTVGFFIDQAGNTHGFKDVGGQFTTVDQPGMPLNTLNSINSRGVAAGFSQDANGNQHNYLYSVGRNGPNFQQLNVGMPSSQATGLSDNGLEVGFEQPSGTATTGQGWMFNTSSNNQQQQVTTLNFPNSPFTMPMGVNNNGQVVGTYLDATTGNMHGFEYSNGNFENIDVPGATNTTVTGINAQGWIVGFFVDPNQNGNTIGLVGQPSS